MYYTAKTCHAAGCTLRKLCQTQNSRAAYVRSSHNARPKAHPVLHARVQPPPRALSKGAHLQHLRRGQRCCAALAGALHGRAARGPLLRNRNNWLLIAGRFVLDLNAVYDLARARNLHTAGAALGWIER